MMTESVIPKEEYEVVDARKLGGNFLPAIQKKASMLEVGQGLRVIQGFEPIPLYSVLDAMGYEHETVKVRDDEYHVYFRRASAVHGQDAGTPPLQPLGILKMKEVDPFIADHMVKIWERVYEREGAAIDQKNLLLIAFGVGVGANRMRQAARELIKAYAAGAAIQELDEVFSMLIWLQGASTFVSEISTSAAFEAYALIKKLEEQGKQRGEVIQTLKEKFGERHPGVGIFAERS